MSPNFFLQVIYFCSPFAGTHRYIFAVFAGPKRARTDVKNIWSSSRNNFNIQDFQEEYDLQGPLALTFVRVSHGLLELKLFVSKMTTYALTFWVLKLGGGQTQGQQLFQRAVDQILLDIGQKQNPQPAKPDVKPEDDDETTCAHNHLSLECNLPGLFLLL